MAFASNKSVNDAITPISAERRVFGLRDHASLWFSLGVGLLVMQVGAYLMPALGTREALIAIVAGSLLGAFLLGSVAKLGADSGLASAGLMHAVYGGAAGAARMKRLKREWKKEWKQEWQEKRAKWHKPVDVEAAKADIIRKCEAMDRPRMVAIAQDPEKRRAWELINGPQDWSKFERR